MDTKKRAAYLAEAAPKLREQDVRAVNSLYPAYIFRRRKTREVWTSCCGRHAVLKEGHLLLDAPHTRELTQRELTQRELYWEARSCWVGHYGMTPPEPVDCPFCGAKAKLKELGRTGKRDNLAAFRRVIVLRKRGGVLWGLGFRTEKDYEWLGALTAPPDMMLIHIYRFEAGRAEHIERSYWNPYEWRGYERIGGGASQSPPTLGAGWKFSDGFNHCSEYGTGYDLIDADGEEGTPFQYCCFDQYNGAEQMRYLALCAVYPRQAEMLMKAGLREIVTDMTEKGKLNARVVDWDDPNPLRSLGLTKPELKEFLAGDKNLNALYAFRRLKRAGVAVTFEELEALRTYTTGVYFEKTARLLAKYRLRWERLHNYLERERRAAKGRKKVGPTSSHMIGLWNDYIDAAAVLGYDLKNDVYLLPKGLEAKHDAATRAASAVLESRRKKENKKKEAARCRALAKRYAYTDGRWLIRPPVSAAEIVAEGKVLQHCVGGYADRHVNGSTTILFLRDRRHPGKPLVTIEMWNGGQEIRQIHGYRNEREKCKENPKRISPRKLYAEFLEPWLAWVAAGSPRDKKGRPKVPETASERIQISA